MHTEQRKWYSWKSQWMSMNERQKKERKKMCFVVQRERERWMRTLTLYRCVFHYVRAEWAHKVYTTNKLILFPFSVWSVCLFFWSSISFGLFVLVSQVELSSSNLNFKITLVTFLCLFFPSPLFLLLFCFNYLMT